MHFLIVLVSKMHFIIVLVSKMHFLIVLASKMHFLIVPGPAGVVTFRNIVIECDGKDCAWRRPGVGVGDVLLL